MTSLTLLVLAVGTVGAQPTLLDFYSEHCGPCRQMTPVIAELERRGYAVEKVDVDRQPDLAAKYRVESIPCLVVVVDGREVDRTLGVTSIERLESMLRTAGTANAAVAAPSVPAPAVSQPAPAVPQIPAVRGPRRGPFAGALAGAAGGRGRSPRGTATRGRQPLGGTGTPRLSPSEQVRPQGEPNESLEAMADAPPASAPSNPQQLSSIESELPLHSAVAGADFAAQPNLEPPGGWKPSSVEGSASQAAAHSEAPVETDSQNGTSAEQLLAVSVRLKIDDGTGHSDVGSGTIIDVRGEDALVLTCGHVFRDSHGKGTVTVDMFGPGAPQGVPGEVISYDLESDVGLVSFRPGVQAAVARVAPPGLKVKAGDPVFNSGCNHGAEPTVRSSRVSSIDKYLGPSNLQVAGQPVQGRSGGGLFNAQGEVIGVCNAADPQDNEGLYAALPSIYKLLDTAGLAQVYQPGAAAIASTQGPGTVAPVASPRPPHMPEQMPLAANPAQATETSAPLGSPLADHGSGVEIVCVVRNSIDPSARNEVIVLDRASPEFLKQLALERERQQSFNQVVPAREAIGQTPSRAPVYQAQQIDPRTAVMR